jgi:hypothetical protein
MIARSVPATLRAVAFLPWLIACGPTTPSGQGPDQQADAAEIEEVPPCLAQPIGDHGVGRPCSKADDCKGNFAVTCLTDLGPGGPAMCTEYCFGFPGECAGGVCMTRGKKAAVCVPAACAARYTVLVPSGVTCTDDCFATPSELGVGKPCTTHAECSGQIARSCPYVYKPTNQKWCSMLCSEDEDCGKGAVCWRRQAEEYGVKFVIGSCANEACCKKP